ncbi:MAG TPA: ATP-binding cassette domain-containing protein [Opitutales bacterium]|nr:ATP-binding cassette domain-containing protein [Opitutales bacterium]
MRRKAVPVHIDHVSKSFGDHLVLDDIDVKIEPGEIFVIMGPSGSGKSVLLKIISGLEDASKGTVHINDLDIRDRGFREKTRLALVFQAGALFNSMTVFDNLALYPREHRIYDRNTIRDKVMDSLKILGLEGAQDKIPAELSGGMRKRVAIARALVMEPQLILYDEPTSELDPIMAASISEIIATLREEQGVTSIVVSHDRDLSLTIADRVGILIDGKLIAMSTPDKLKSSNDPTINEFLNPSIDIENPRFKQIRQSS